MSTIRLSAALALATVVGVAACEAEYPRGNSCLENPCCRDPQSEACCEANSGSCGASDGGPLIGNVVHPLDAGSLVDAGLADAGPADAGPPGDDAGDAEVEPWDADTGPVDFDAGPSDSGLQDGNGVSSTDAGLPGNPDGGGWDGGL
jgi:hypothetical protein